MPNNHPEDFEATKNINRLLRVIKKYVVKNENNTRVSYRPLVASWDSKRRTIPSAYTGDRYRRKLTTDHTHTLCCSPFAENIWAMGGRLTRTQQDLSVTQWLLLLLLLYSHTLQSYLCPAIASSKQLHFPRCARSSRYKNGGSGRSAACSLARHLCRARENARRDGACQSRWRSGSANGMEISRWAVATVWLIIKSPNLWSCAALVGWRTNN